MKKRALHKDFWMELKRTWTRFLSILLIVALGVSFFAGLRACKEDMLETSDAFYDETNFMDLSIVSSYGLTQDDLSVLQQLPTLDAVEGSYSKEVLVQLESQNLVVKSYSLNDKINQFYLMEGRTPQTNTECMVDTLFLENTGYQIGDQIQLTLETEDLSESLNEINLTIVGSCNDPKFISFYRGNGDIGTGNVNSFIVLPKSNFKQEIFQEAYATVKGAKEISAYTNEYENLIKKAKEEILVMPEWYVGDRNWIESYVSYQTDADRIDAIAKVFPAIFFFVAALVCLTTMTRMVDEQRTQIGIMKALGYGKLSIAGKFMKYAFFATVLGSILGVLVGQKLFPYIVIDAYRIMYAGLPYILTNYQPTYAILASVLAIVCTMIATYIACMADLRSEPAQLMRPAAPKVGKRILLERIPIFWNHINFTKKSTLRNLFRYKKRFLMTVIGIAGCMGLIIVGFGLKDSIGVMADLQYKDLWLQDAQISFKSDLGETQRQDWLSEITSDDRITKVAMLYSKGVETTYEDNSKSSTLYVLETPQDYDQFFLFRDRESLEPYKITNEGVIITEKFATMLSASVGDEIHLDLADVGVVGVTVSAISENYLGHYLFMTSELYQSLTGGFPDYNQALLRTVNLTQAEEEKLFIDILEDAAVMSLQSTQSLNERIDDMLESLNIVTYVLIVSAGLLAFIVLYNLSNININERKRELASLKVLGFYDGEVNSYVMRENILLTILGIGFGVLLGKVLHGFVIKTCEIDAVMFGRLIKPESYVISGVFTLFFSLVICFFMYFKLKRIDMIESLKSVE